MSSAVPQPSRRRGPRWRLLLFAVLLGVALGGLLARASLRQSPAAGEFEPRVVFLDESRRGGPGRPYLVEFEIPTDGYPLLVHVDQDGVPSLLFPSGPSVRLRSGVRMRLPSVDGSAAWWLPAGDEPGWLILAVSEQPLDDPERVLAAVERESATAGGPEAVRRRLAEELRRRVGPAREVRLAVR